MFIGRNKDGSIYGLWTVRQWEGQEELPGDNAEVVNFINRQSAPKPLTDGALASLLVEKGFITTAEVAAAIK